MERNRITQFSMRWGTVFLFALAMLTIVAPEADAARHRVHKKRAVISTAAGVNDARYADIIMNPVTGEVYHQDDPDARRYPASLTKMMTLYLLFEALAQNKTTMGAHLDISDYAASMPQTNLALEPGDTIPVEVAIKALIVRSANDVAIVVGEALGGDVDHFAQMMTAKARALGMRNTVFRNPNGLPNSEQYTTARDMAKLGIALKRDFPRFYPYFNTRQFSWKGATYYTHNRVMLRYPGTDGIKTGFVGASGFNVVTSVVRGGRPLVGVVMGGASGGWRDNRMIQLLDQSYKVIASRGAVRGKIYAENLPLGKNGPGGRGIAPQAVTPEDISTANASLSEEDVGESDTAEGEEESKPAMAVAQTVAAPVAPVPAASMPTASAQVSNPAPSPIDKKPAVTASVASAPKESPAARPTPAITAGAQPVVVHGPAQGVGTGAGMHPPPQVVRISESLTIAPKPPSAPPAAAPGTANGTPALAGGAVSAAPVSPFSYATANTASGLPKTAASPAITGVNGPIWGIQVGAFSSSELALRAVNDAYKLATPTLIGAKTAVAGPEMGGAPVYRARLVNITETQAKSACSKLIANSSPCFTFRTAN